MILLPSPARVSRGQRGDFQAGRCWGTPRTWPTSWTCAMIVGRVETYFIAGDIDDLSGINSSLIHARIGRFSRNSSRTAFGGVALKKKRCMAMYGW